MLFKEKTIPAKREYILSSEQLKEAIIEYVKVRAIDFPKGSAYVSIEPDHTKLKGYGAYLIVSDL